jgi:hypothetical protein
MSISESSSVVRLKERVSSQIQQTTRENKIMKYMLLIYDNEQDWSKLSESERQQIYSEYGKLTQEVKANGKYLAGSQLQPTSTATSVRVRDEKQLVTDGPFAETHEQLGGYYLIEAKDLDEATAIAARIPSARLGTVEVRPVVEMGAQATA